MKKSELKNLLTFASILVQRSESITLGYFRKNLVPQKKADNTPVTIADKKCENFMIKEIKRIYPEHGILSEENGEMESNSGYKWIIDPIDGTKNFIRNYMTWGTLLALEHDSEVVLGIISLPAMKKLIVAAKGQGCFVNGKRAVVSGISRIKDSYCLYGGMGSILKKKYSNNFLDLVSRCYYSRGFGDCHGHSLVISGDAEIMVDPSTSPYDVAPIKICIEEAGGVFTDLKGNATIYGGNALTTNGKLHDKILSMLNR